MASKRLSWRDQVIIPILTHTVVFIIGGFIVWAYLGGQQTLEMNQAKNVMDTVQKVVDNQKQICERPPEVGIYTNCLQVLDNMQYRLSDIQKDYLAGNYQAVIEKGKMFGYTQLSGSFSLIWLTFIVLILFIGGYAYYAYYVYSQRKKNNTD